MDDERDIALDAKLREQNIEIAPVLNESIGERPACGQLLRISHPKQIRSNTTAFLLQVGKNIAPEVRRGRIAVEKNERVSLPDIYVRHSTVKHVQKLLLVGHDFTDHRNLPSPSSVRLFFPRLHCIKPPALHVPNCSDLAGVVAIVGDHAVNEMTACMPLITFGDSMI